MKDIQGGHNCGRTYRVANTIAEHTGWTKLRRTFRMDKLRRSYRMGKNVQGIKDVQNFAGHIVWEKTLQDIKSRQKFAEHTGCAKLYRTYPTGWSKLCSPYTTGWSKLCRTYRVGKTVQDIKGGQNCAGRKGWSKLCRT